MTRGKTEEITCACGCGRKKMVRTADIKRGWGKYFSKRCKARHQCKTHDHERDELYNEIHPHSEEAFECPSFK